MQEMQRRGKGLGIDHFPVQPGLVGTPLLNMDPDAQKLDPKKPASWLMWTQVGGRGLVQAVSRGW